MTAYTSKLATVDHLYEKPILMRHHKERKRERDNLREKAICVYGWGGRKRRGGEQRQLQHESPKLRSRDLQPCTLILQVVASIRFLTWYLELFSVMACTRRATACWRVCCSLQQRGEVDFKGSGGRERLAGQVINCSRTCEETFSCYFVLCVNFTHSSCTAFCLVSSQFSWFSIFFQSRAVI